MDETTTRFIGEPIEAEFDQPPEIEKKPGLPDNFVWRDSTFTVAETLSEWHDFGRRDRMARNMRPSHAAAAARKGSWGVGRDYYRILTDCGRTFEIYFDRSPTSSNRKGSWHMDREIGEKKK
jgi:hypothetical protein